jgi:xyloglucan-specific exo-beta-1,4-glucanase
MRKLCWAATLIIAPFLIQAQEIPTQGENYFDIVQNYQTDGNADLESSSFNAFEKWQWYWGPRLYPHGDFNAYSRTWNGLGSLPSESSDLPPSNWEEIGPTSELIPNPGVNTGGWTGIGRAIDIEIVKPDPANPTAPLTMFVGTWGGGVWKTTNAGLSWENYGTDKGLPILTTGSIEIDQDNPDRMWVTTGGKYRHDNVSRGVYRTMDAGITWDAANNGIPDLSTTILLSKLLIHPANPDIMHLVSSEGLYRTDNATTGCNWNLVTDAPTDNL